MKILEPGYKYELNEFDKEWDDISTQTLTFFCRDAGNEHSGTNSQEVLRILIDKIKYEEEHIPNNLNKEIIHHLRMALVTIEARSLISIQKHNYIAIEQFSTNSYGNIKISNE